MANILDDFSSVRGIIYCIEHTATSRKYVGQTRSHRLNHGRYRPFGAEGRFRDHISCALRNTKEDQCSALYNDIRLHGRDAFVYSQLEECDISSLDDREKHWIASLGTTYPAGYNLTVGGRAGSKLIAHVGGNHSRNPAGKRGGSTVRSAETREKMSASMSAALSTHEAREQRATQARNQHELQKAARFANVTIDPDNLDQYISLRGNRAMVQVGEAVASFTGKSSSKDESLKRAKEFLLTVAATATLSNCSGNP